MDNTPCPREDEHREVFTASEGRTSPTRRHQKKKNPPPLTSERPRTPRQSGTWASACKRRGAESRRQPHACRRPSTSADRPPSVCPCCSNKRRLRVGGRAAPAPAAAPADALLSRPGRKTDVAERTPRSPRGFAGRQLQKAGWL